MVFYPRGVCCNGVLSLWSVLQWCSILVECAAMVFYPRGVRYNGVLSSWSALQWCSLHIFPVRLAQ